MLLLHKELEWTPSFQSYCTVTILMCDCILPTLLRQHVTCQHQVTCAYIVTKRIYFSAVSICVFSAHTCCIIASTMTV